MFVFDQTSLSESRVNVSVYKQFLADVTWFDLFEFLAREQLHCRPRQGVLKSLPALFNSNLLCFCSRVMTYREHGAWVVKAHLQKETDGHIISVRYPPR